MPCPKIIVHATEKKVKFVPPINLKKVNLPYRKRSPQGRRRHSSAKPPILLRRTLTPHVQTIYKLAQEKCENGDEFFRNKDYSKSKEEYMLCGKLIKLYKETSEISHHITDIAEHVCSQLVILCKKIDPIYTDREFKFISELSIKSGLYQLPTYFKAIHQHKMIAKESQKLNNFILRFKSYSEK